MSERKDLLGSVGRVVVKIGSSSIMRDGRSISTAFMDSVAEQVKLLKEKGIEVIIVTSGAIPLGLKAMGVKPKPNEIPIKQAAASVGQVVLMQKWAESFEKYGLIIGQILLTMDTYSDRESTLNLSNTMDSLISNGVVPIFNENDAIRTNEIKFGDNDTLSAIIASRVDADLLVILSDIDGLYDGNPRTNSDAKFIPLVREVDASIEAMAGDAGSSVGTGGMKTKIQAAKICRDAGCMMIIARSSDYGVVYRTTVGDEVGTLFLSDSSISKKRRWIKAVHTNASVVIDSGAEVAIGKHCSLLPIGIVSVEGSFEKGEVVDIVCEGHLVAKGIPSYGSEELRRIAGKHSDEINRILGYRTHDDAFISENIARL